MTVRGRSGRDDLLMTRFDPFFQQALDDLGDRALRRRLNPVTRTVADTSRLHRDGQVLRDFSSNDYLGLSLHPVLRTRAADWAQRYGTGSRASRLVSGTLDLHEAVEARLARFKGTEEALIFASGWQANAAVLPALFELSRSLTGHPALVFTDRLNHASLHHGCQAAGIRQIRFRHNDLGHLDDLLTHHADKPGLRFILTESVFSMDGDRADVGALRALASRHDAFLYLDEAHATGVLGPGGAGLSAGHQVDLAMGTFSKALGGMGAYIAGSQALCDYLINTASGFVYSTAPSPPMLGAMDAALELAAGMDGERAKLAASAERLRLMLRDAGLDTGRSTTQIIPVILGDAQRAVDIAQRLATRGILAIAIRPPTVPRNEARLRLALSAVHEPEDIDILAREVIAATKEVSL